MLWKKSRRTFLGEKNQMFLNDKKPKTNITYSVKKNTYTHSDWLALVLGLDLGS